MIVSDARRPLVSVQYQHGSVALQPISTDSPYLVLTAEHRAIPSLSLDNPVTAYSGEVFRSDPDQYTLHDESVIDHLQADDGELNLPVTLVDAPTELPSPEIPEMKQAKTKCTIGVLSCMIAYMSVNSWYKAVNPQAFVWCDEDKDEAFWVATSKSWLDRKACRWLGVCGGRHMHWARNPFGFRIISDGDDDDDDDNDTDDWEWRDQWSDPTIKLVDDTPLHSDRRSVIPPFVLEYAPLVHLFSGEQFWPCDLEEHLYHTTPYLNYTPIQSQDQHTTLADLDQLNQWEDGLNVFLTSNDNVEERPEWLEGVKNIPQQVSAEGASPDDNDGWVHHPPRTYLQGLRDAARALGKELNDEIDLDTLDTGNVDTSDETVRLLREEAKALLDEELKGGSARSASKAYTHKIRGGRSSAPAILITVAKPGGILDAFWFFFYSFNLGNTVLDVRFGNHIGDWEHTAVRFVDGKPQAVFVSEHNFGSAYSYEAIEKLGKRPVIYSGTGTHAMYATPGLHPYILPFGLLHDETDRGPLWDPALNHHSYTYDPEEDMLLASNLTPQSPANWFHFTGHWGDKFYSLNDKRQYRIIGQYHYVNGPLGPKFKNLARKQICGGPDGTPCVIKHWLGTGGKIQKSASNGEEADPWSAAYKEKIRLELK